MGALGMLRLQRQPAVMARQGRSRWWIFRMVIEETRMPSSASMASMRLQPPEGCASARSLIV
jgi:hypothetical protein